MLAFIHLKDSFVVQSPSLVWHFVTGLQHIRLSCPSPSPRVCPSSLHWWCHPTISSSVAVFSFCLQSFPAPGAFPMSQLFASGGQSIGVLASVLPMSIQGWFPLRLTGLIFFLSKGLSRVLQHHSLKAPILQYSAQIFFVIH